MLFRLFYFTVFISLFGSPIPVAAQHPLVNSLAAKFCSCMEGGTTEEASEMAEGCLDSLTAIYQKDIYKQLELDVRKASHRVRLVNELIDPLALNCPILQTLSAAEKEFRWSDIKEVVPQIDRFQSPKSPPPDPSGRNTAEPPIRWEARGELRARPAGGSFSLLLADGSLQVFELPFGLLGKRRLKAGQKIKVVYRREWRKGEISRIVNVALEFK